MPAIGRVESLWRYPVKSMAGEALEEAFVGFSGVYGDRLFAFTSSAAPAGFPYFTGREQSAMLRYRPRFRRPDRAERPRNLAEAEGMAPGLTPVYGDRDELGVDVVTPSGEVLAVDDPALLQRLGQGLDEKHRLALSRSDRALTDCRPVSLFAVETARQLGEEVGIEVDPRRFRANIYLHLESGGFAENAQVGHSLRIGPKAVVAVLERDPRCKMITLHPDTGEASPALMVKVAKAHEGTAGVYGAVLVEGMVRRGDPIERV